MISVTIAEDMDVEATGAVEDEGRREEETPLDFLGMSAAPTTPGAASTVEPASAVPSDMSCSLCYVTLS